MKLSTDGIIEGNQKTHILFLKVREIAEKIKHSTDEDKDLLYEEYSFSTYDFII